jgi:hypothetical protein
LKNFITSAGFHTDTNAIKHILHFDCSEEVKDLLSEEMLLGIGGGVGYGYFTFYYEKEDFSSLFIGTRASWESSTDFINDTLRALGCTPTITQTNNKKVAFDKLVDNIQNEIPTIIAIHQGVFENMKIDQNWYQTYSVVYDIDKDKGTANLTNRYAMGVEISLDDLIEGRNNLATSKLKNQAIFIGNRDEVRKINAETVMKAGRVGIVSFIKHANNPRMTNFGISALEKWESLLTAKSKQSWIKLFGEPKHLVEALYYTNYWIVNNTDGFALRKKYAQFLKKIGTIINEPLLLNASELFEKSSILWGKLADEALTSEVPEFRKIKELILECNSGIITGKLLHNEYIKKLDEIRELKKDAIEAIDWSEQQKIEHFGRLAEIVSEIKMMELEALSVLEKAVQSSRWDEYSSGVWK